MDDMMEIGVACDGSGLDGVGSDGILHVLVLGMRSPSNSELSFSACRT